MTSKKKYRHWIQTYKNRLDEQSLDPSQHDASFALLQKYGTLHNCEGQEKEYA